MGEPAAEAATSERDVLLATKLNVPGVRPDLVPRPRLAQRLDEGRGRGLVLACAPEFEAASYNYSTATNIYPEIATIQIPVTILRAHRSENSFALNMTDSPTAPDLAAQFPHGTDVYLPDHSHFIPMEAPELVADTIRKQLAVSN